LGRLFGTDGVRGVAGRELTARFATDLATAAAAVLSSSGDREPGAQPGPDRPRPVAVVGRDPRASGQFLEAAVVAGLAGAGIDVLRLGVVPTPAVAYLTGALSADFGVMLSASHNPAPDNGIKFFSRGGFKLPDEIEDQIERYLGAGPADGPRLPEAGFGRVTDAAAQADRYLTHLLSTLPGPGGGTPLSGLRVVVDCAHGAASDLAPRLLSRAGADVIAIGAEPDGDNINAGYGSTSIGALSAAVQVHGADAGLAFDGDADRCLAVDAAGQLIDGDQILAVLAFALHDAGRLPGRTLVATVMSNLGLRLAMRDAGINVVETPVGDRYVLAAMLDGGFILGGEQSGHIILLDHATTGDGLLTGLQLLSVTAERGQPLGELAKVLTRYPQVLISVPGVDKARVAVAAGLAAAVAAAEAELGDSGRVLVRPSGTEDTVRIMVESADAAQARRLADKLGEVVREVGTP
jgi:phosphoglucosamine mutase